MSRDDALVTLGVGKNMVQSIRHWLLAMGMATVDGRGLRVTNLGREVFGDEAGWDPYLEDDATLWLLHWQVTAPLSPALSWVWAFHEMAGTGFTKRMLTESVLAAAQAKLPKAPGAETVSRDVDCLLHTYVAPERAEVSSDTLDCPLQLLGLIGLVDRGKQDRESEPRYRFRVGPKPTLPAAFFYYALASFWRWRKTAVSLTVQEVAYGAGGRAGRSSWMRTACWSIWTGWSRRRRVAFGSTMRR